MSQHEANLLLIGLRGAGKSSVGRVVAWRQGRAFVDLDDVTTAFLGCDSVAEAWGRHGETGFREAEARALAAALHDEGRVIAAGGGTPTAPGAEEILAGAAGEGRVVVVYLRLLPAALRARLAGQGSAGLANRPSLTGAPMLDEIERVFEARDALYQRLATRVVEGEWSIDECAEALDGWPSW